VSKRLRYAAYGSNLHPQRLRERIEHAKLVGTSFLEQHTLQFHKRGQDQSAKCSFSSCGRGMHVAVYEIDESGKQVLDRIEGAGRGYNVANLHVPDIGECFTYIAARTHIDELLQPFDWYREMVLLGCRSHAFPGAYCDRIAAIPAVADPDAGRRAKNWEIVDRLR
jgi:gamma-glutamylcyclotransferase (GGCT)/AIG2-like uncharacterized protein YtfP